jgi:hypothetical protein
MKRGIVIGMLLTLCLGAARSKYWQDVLLKPNQAWIESYGHNPDSVMAYNVRKLIEAQSAANKEITALKLSLSDPNDSKE